MVGLEPVTQKTFESRLAARLRGPLRSAPCCVLEGESRKVGDIVVPDGVWRVLRGGTSLELVASVPRRVQVLIDDYLARPGSRDELARQLPFIEERLGRTKWKGALVQLLAEERDDELVRILLERYYDPLYRRSEEQHTYSTRIDTEDEEVAAGEVVAWVEARLDSAP